jgi:hypothetical protein
MSLYRNRRENSFNSSLWRLIEHLEDFKKSRPDEISIYNEGIEKRIQEERGGLAPLVVQQALFLEICIDHILNGKQLGAEVTELDEARRKRLLKWKDRSKMRKPYYGSESQNVKLGQIPSFHEGRKSKSRPKEGLRDLLLWLLSPTKASMRKDATELSENDSVRWSKFKIYDEHSPARGGDLDFTANVPLLSMLEAALMDIDLGFPSKNLSSYDFWHIYLHVSKKLHEKNSKSERERHEELVDKAMIAILEEVKKAEEPKDDDGKKNIPVDEIRRALELPIKNKRRETLRNEVLKDAADERAKAFKEYINQELDSETYRQERTSYKKEGFRWLETDTIKRGVYYTEDAWIERNIFARCLMIISGLDPYTKSNSTELETAKGPAMKGTSSPAMRGAFELKSVLYEMEGRVARWHALGKYTSSLKIVSYHLREIVDLFILFDKLHQSFNEIALGTQEQPIIIEESSQGRRKKDLISLNDIALLTSIQPKTILNEAKILQDSPVENAKFAEKINEREELCWKLYKDRNVREDNSEKRIISMLTTVEKNEIHPNDRESFNSRCYSIRSVIRWILYKQYDLNNSGVGSAAQKMKIPLDWEPHEKEFDLGLKELF